MERQEVIVDLPHIRLAGLRYGQGRHVVLALHGWLDNAMSFAPLADYLVGEEVSILALDFAGHGHSAHRPLSSGYHFTDYVRDVVLAAEQLGLERLDLLCHSMGAAVGTLLAGAFPERVARLVCVELYGVGVISDKEDLPQRFRENLMQLDYERARAERVYKSFSQLVRARRVAGELSEVSAARLLARNTVKVCDGYRFLSDRRLRFWQPAVFSEAQNLRFIREILAPVLVVEAQEGLLPAWDFMQARYQATANIEVKRLQGGHHLHMDNAKEVAAVVLDFWKRHPCVVL